MRRKPAAAAACGEPALRQSNVNITLFSRVTLISKVRSTSDLDYFHARDLYNTIRSSIQGTQCTTPPPSDHTQSHATLFLSLSVSVTIVRRAFALRLIIRRTTVFTAKTLNRLHALASRQDHNSLDNRIS